MTKLEKPLKRELDIGGKAYVLTISPEGLKLTEKGHRKGHELAWHAIVGAPESHAAEPGAPQL